MPTSKQHSIRVVEGLKFISATQTKEHPNELVIAYFYTVLHMFEAVAHDFHPKKRDFRNHGERKDFFHEIRFEPKHLFVSVGADYDALRDLSEQARYLSPANSETYEPIVPKRDVPQALFLHDALRKRFESIYASRKNSIPWTPK